MRKVFQYSKLALALGLLASGFAYADSVAPLSPNQQPASSVSTPATVVSPDPNSAAIPAQSTLPAPSLSLGSQEPSAVAAAPSGDGQQPVGLQAPVPQQQYANQSPQAEQAPPAQQQYANQSPQAEQAPPAQQQYANQGPQAEQAPPAQQQYANQGPQAEQASPAQQQYANQGPQAEQGPPPQQQYVDQGPPPPDQYYGDQGPQGEQGPPPNGPNGPCPNFSAGHYAQNGSWIPAHCPGQSVFIRGYYNPNGVWVPGHWAQTAGGPGHHNPYHPDYDDGYNG